MMVCEPTASELRVSVAIPETFKVPLPAGVPLSRKLTVPVGVPLPAVDGVTVALSVIVWPDTLGLGELVKAVVVALWTCSSSVAVVGRKVASPL